MLEYGSCKLYRISKNTNEYKRLQRTLTGDNKMSDLEVEQINDSLMEDARHKLSGQSEVYLLHDPCDIRKPHSKKTESLGNVRDLKGNIINGYSSYNVVAITPHGGAVHLLSHVAYSNKEDKFLKAKVVKQLDAGKDFDGKENAQSLYDSEEWFNKKTVSKENIKQVSDGLKATNPHLKLTHVLDREFDDDDYFNEISSQGDEFVVRAKKSRSASNTQDGDGKKIKLIDSCFEHESIQLLQKVRFKKQCYQDASLHIEWSTHQENYTAIKITAKDRAGNNIFKVPMLLITNKSVSSAEEAFLIYLIYLKRSRIETVFKFLKEGLGWEEMQLHDFQGIKNLLSCCFFLAAYLYEIGEQEAYDDYSILLAELGGGKGIVSRCYILNGIKALLTKYRVDGILEKHKPSEKTMENILAIAGMDL